MTFLGPELTLVNIPKDVGFAGSSGRNSDF